MFTSKDTPSLNMQDWVFAVTLTDHRSNQQLTSSFYDNKFSPGKGIVTVDAWNA